MSVPALRSKDPAAQGCSRGRAVGMQWGRAVSVPAYVRKAEGSTLVQILASVRWLPKNSQGKLWWHYQRPRGPVSRATHHSVR